MIDLSQAQVTDLHELQKLCDKLHADFVIIGAIAFQVHFPDEERHTGDIDCSVALDLDAFGIAPLGCGGVDAPICDFGFGLGPPYGVSILHPPIPRGMRDREPPLTVSRL